MVWIYKENERSDKMDMGHKWRGQRERGGTED